MNIATVNFQQRIFIPISKIRSAAQLVCRRLRFKSSDLSIVFVGERRMRTLNRKYLRHDHVTDVLSFPSRTMFGIVGNPVFGSPIKTFGDDNLFHSLGGEIIVCPAVARRNAKRYGNSIEREILLYVVHGILHLCGYDDHKPADIQRMRRKEQQIMDLLQ